MKQIVALDIAKTMGVCFHKHPDGNFYCTAYSGTPQEQLEMLLDVLGDDVKNTLFFIEELNSFVNAKTTRSLLHRVGFIKLTLEKLGAKVEMVNAMAARKFLGAKNKKDVGNIFQALDFPKMTDDEADALAIMLFALDINPLLIKGGKESKICVMNTK
jgi:hypothetical protein